MPLISGKSYFRESPASSAIFVPAMGEGMLERTVSIPGKSESAMPISLYCTASGRTASILTPLTVPVRVMRFLFTAMVGSTVADRSQSPPFRLKPPVIQGIFLSSPLVFTLRKAFTSTPLTLPENSAFTRYLV